MGCLQSQFRYLADTIFYASAEAFEKNYRKIVTMTIRIPSSVSSADESAVTKIMEALVRIPLMLIDILAASKGIMSSDTKSKIREAREKERKKFSKAEEQKRMEELRKRKLEAKKAELAMMNPKDRAKQEEKDAERERKKRAKAGKQRVVMA